MPTKQPTLYRTMLKAEDFDGYFNIYRIRPGGLMMREYLTPDWNWSPHVYQGEVFRTTADLEDALQWVRNNGDSPTLVPSDEQPVDPRYDLTIQRPPSAWRMWR